MADTTQVTVTAVTDEVEAVAADLARASLALARRFSAGATMWCASPNWTFHAHHVAVEFVHPVIMGKRALPAVTVPPAADMVASLRASVVPGDIVLVLADADDPRVVDTMRRGPAWGVETVWIGAGARRPEPGSANHVIWLETEDALEASELFVRIYHLLWELTHVCFEHPGLLKPEPECTSTGEIGSVCITCSDEGRPAEVVSVDGDEALVRTPDGQEHIDVSLIDPPTPGDLVLIHAGFAITASPSMAPGG
ncbi:MAG TPA: HypC/HybG/HupF family hydrogenase formation chaperone [Acidimicrobiales bacterium]|nr:HypC/HybG/HupF family hydrogenase formation chaperone [Acidimicrobiales bacterium]